MPFDPALLEAIENNDAQIKEVFLTNTWPLINSMDIELLVNAIQKNNNSILTKIQLPENVIGDEGAIALSKLIYIEILALDDNNITDKGALALAKMPHLKFLDLGGNDIGDLSFKALIQHSSLTSLSIRSDLVTSDVAKLAFQNYHLQFLDLQGNQLDESLLKDIQVHIIKNSNEQDINSLFDTEKNFWERQETLSNSYKDELTKEEINEDDMSWASTPPLFKDSSASLPFKKQTSFKKSFDLETRAYHLVQSFKKQSEDLGQNEIEELKVLLLEKLQSFLLTKKATS